MKRISIIEGALMATVIVFVTAGVVLAVNPAQQIAERNNMKRRQDIERIASAIAEYRLDHSNVLPIDIPALTAREICKHGISADACGDGVDISSLVDPLLLYLDGIPTDPFVATHATGTGYVVVKGNGKRPEIIVSAPYAELGEVIEVKR